MEKFVDYMFEHSATIERTISDLSASVRRQASTTKIVGTLMLIGMGVMAYKLKMQQLDIYELEEKVK